jgi:hypothetical protein
VSSHPVLVSSRSARETLGPEWTSRKFIRFLRVRGVRHSRDGRLLVARVDDVLSALGLGDEAQAEAPSWSPNDVILQLRNGR